MKKQLIRAAAATVLGLSLTTGLAAADINTTGPDSNNGVKTTNSSKVTVQNNNNLSASSDNWQAAHTGEASAYHNTTAGDVATGSASNDGSFGVSATVDNSGSALAASDMSVGDPSSTEGVISNTGPDSDNYITTTNTSKYTVTNNNNLNVSSDNDQSATSGSAKVSDNTTGGDATTGDASNTSSSTVVFDVTN